MTGVSIQVLYKALEMNMSRLPPIYHLVSQFSNMVQVMKFLETHVARMQFCAISERGKVSLQLRK